MADFVVVVVVAVHYSIVCMLDCVSLFALAAFRLRTTHEFSLQTSLVGQ